MKTSSTLKQFLVSLTDYSRRQLVFIGLLMLLVGLTEGVGLMMLVPLLSLVGLGAQAEQSNWLMDTFGFVFQNLGISFSLPAILVLFLTFVIIQALMRRNTDFLASEFALGFADSLRQKLFRSMSYADWLFFTSRPTSDYTHVLISNIGRVEQGTHFFLRLWVVSALIVSYVVVSLVLSPTVTVATLLVGIALLMLLRPLHQKASKQGELLTETNRDLYNAINEYTSGTRLAKIYGREEQQSEAFDRKTNRLRYGQLQYLRSSSSARTWFKIGGALALSLIVYYASTTKTVSTVELLVLIFIFARLIPMLSEAQQSYQHCLHMLPAFNSATKLYQSCMAAKEQGADDNVNTPTLNQEIRLSNINFHYKEDQSTLVDINLQIPAYSTVALVGPSGAGKSTLADLLTGLISPGAGQILVDGIEIDKSRQLSWRHKVAYVAQETFLFHQSIRDNLLWIKPEANEAELKNVLKLAAAESFIEALPEGMDTVVGERGAELSGGERQRIAIAQALLRNPRLLVLDEATSALDRENERQIQLAMKALRGKTTLIIIAHRRSTVSHADKIILLDSGRVIDSGSWGEVEGRNRQYFVDMFDDMNTDTSQQGPEERQN